MPVHHIIPYASEDFEVQPPVTGKAERVCIVDCGIQLRRLDNNEDRFIPGAPYRESWVILPNWRASGLKAIYGFYAEIVTEGKRLSDFFGGSVKFQASNDNGITWLHWDGSAWVSTTEDWNTKEELDAYLPHFPLNGQIRIRALLIPGERGRTTPVLRQVSFYGEMQLNLTDDLIRSMKRWLEEKMWMPARYYADLHREDYIKIDRGFEVLGGPVTVFNETTDPGRTTNLFNGFHDNGIQLTSRQEGRVVADFRARPPVYIGAEEFMEISNIPSIVVNLVNLRERRDLRHGNPEHDFALARRKAVIYLARTWYEAEFRLSVQSDLRHETVTMSDLLNEALTYHQYMPSLELGETLAIPMSTPFTQGHRVAQGLFVREYSCTIHAKTWLRQDTKTEVDLVEKVVIMPSLLDNEGIVETSPESFVEITNAN